MQVLPLLGADARMGGVMSTLPADESRGYLSTNRGSGSTGTQPHQSPKPP